jgi:hypothetical protein
MKCHQRLEDIQIRKVPRREKQDSSVIRLVETQKRAMSCHKDKRKQRNSKEDC